VQVEDVKETGHRVQRGFSGSAVWDEQLGGVTGMVVATENEEEAATKTAYMIPTDVLVKVWPPLGQQAILPCPYRGLFAFREQDAPFFFGRETVSQHLLEAVRRKPLVAVVGSSGSGKSSVVFAGLRILWTWSCKSTLQHVSSSSSTNLKNSTPSVLQRRAKSLS
jgi:ABC-type multidrug transport system fused ATPase/permease subunit